MAAKKMKRAHWVGTGSKGLILLLLAVMFARSGSLYATTITWGAGVTVSADGDVFTNGALQYAYDWNGSNATVKGVNFAGTSSASGGANVSLSGIGSHYQGYTSTDSPFSTLSSAYQGIIAGGEYGGAVTATVTLNNLAVGRSYAVQVWVNDPRGGSEAGRTETVTGSNVVTLAYNVPAAAGGVGQYTIGVFTAGDTSQTFTLLGGASTQLNALLVSDVTATGYQPLNPPSPPGTVPPQSAWVYFNDAHTLVYSNDDLGNHLPDFSFAGYEEGGVAIPTNEVVRTNLSAIAGDNTASIQNAIKYVSGLAPDANGFRGVVQLSPGTYQIAGTLTISASGVVLRGSGNNTNTGTILLVTGNARNVLSLGGAGSWSKTGSTFTTTDSYVPLGATRFHVSGSPSFAAGSTIVIQRPWTQPWINAIVMSNYWSPGTGLQFERQVTAVSGNQITIDAPLCNPIESQWATGLIYQVTDSQRIQQVGLEDFCAVGQIADYPSNVLTGVFANFTNLKNGWAQNILLSGWGNGITLGSGTKWCTVQDCQYVNPGTGTSSAAPAAWTISGAQCLVQRCVSDGGYYHVMVTQDSTPGPNVFLNLTCSGTHYNGGPHQRWAAGALHDDIVMAADSEGDYTPYLAINNRGSDGSGQGWGAGFSLMYNCQVPQFQLEQPGVTNHYNWTIGGIGSKAAYNDDGIYDALGSLLNPYSLYLEQLRERLGGAAVENIGYPLFTISASPASASLTPGTGIALTVTLGDPTLMSSVVALSASGLPAGLTASWSTNSVTGAGNAILTVTASNLAAPGSYQLNISGANAGLVHTASVSLLVANPFFSISGGSVNWNGPDLVFNGAGGVPEAAYYVLTSTNLSVPRSNWTRLSTNLFGADGSFSFTNAITPQSPGNYYMIRLAP